MIININIGLLGHVDSGKTTLAKLLSEISSTAAFDKHPQSKERGITLDLGFSGLMLDAPNHLRTKVPELQQLQLTFVDCPGHASLIRTIIGGAQIIDLMVLVIDAQKGVQTQTAECIVIGEILRRKVVVVINKIDLLDDATREPYLSKLHMKLRKVFGRTRFGADVPIFDMSATNGTNVNLVLDGICAEISLPLRNVEAPLVIYVDHCFLIKGQGTICTGTVVQGQVAVNDTIEIPLLREQRKIKSIQMFHRSVKSAIMGDRIGLCVTQFDAKLLERGILAKPGYLRRVYATCVHLRRIQYYKLPIKSKSKLHITVGHDTVMGKITLFRDIQNEHSGVFHVDREYEFVEEINCSNDEHDAAIFALIEFETAIIAADESILIASKLDMDEHNNNCRIAFWAQCQWITHSNNYVNEELTKFKIFKSKLRQGSIQRLINNQEGIVANLFKKESNRDIFIGKRIQLSTGEAGLIASTFGQTSKVKIEFSTPLKESTLELIKSGRSSEVLVLLKFKKYVFNRDLGLIQ